MGKQGDLENSELHSKSKGFKSLSAAPSKRLEGYIRLNYTTRQGHFNWSDPSEESYSCHMAVFDEEGKKLISCNIRPEYDENGTEPEDAIYLLEDAIKRSWTTNDDRPHFLQFVKDNQEALEVGNDIYELNQISKQLVKLSERQLQLSQRLNQTVSDNGHAGTLQDHPSKTNDGGSNE